VLVLKNGANPVDLLGDGTKGQAFVAWRGNYNAHGFSTVAFYVLANSDRGDTKPVWQVVPFFGGRNDRDPVPELYHTVEGADCILSDLRVLRHDHSPVEIVVARREFGESFAASAAVQFDYYKLVRNSDGIPGWPPYYFEHSRSAPAKQSYCDVNEAFEQELGLGTNGLSQGEGGR
jgi:hypothetical protein